MKPAERREEVQQPLEPRPETFASCDVAVRQGDVSKYKNTWQEELLLAQQQASAVASGEIGTTLELFPCMTPSARGRPCGLVVH